MNEAKAKRRLNRELWRERLTVPMVALLCTIPIAAFFWYSGKLHGETADGYVRADVIRTVDISGDGGFGLLLHVRLPDGSHVTARTASVGHAMTVIDTACLGIRRRSTGTVLYSVAMPSACD